MKVSLPSHIPMKWVFAFVGALVSVQVVEGTALLLACTAATYIILAALAFNVAGGLQYPSGAYIFFTTIESAILGIVVKTALGEPLHTNLTGAQYTLTVYCVGLFSLLVAAVINRRLRRWPPLLKNKIQYMRANQVGLGCLIIAFAAPLVTPVSLRGTANQFNRFTLFAILLTVAARVKETGGRRSFTWVAFAAWILHTVFIGLFTFSKEGMFAPSASWAIGAVASGYRLSWKKALVIILVAIPAVTLLTPISQLGRYYNADGGNGNVTQTAIDLLSHPLDTRAKYQEEQVEVYLNDADYHWFNQPQGILDRLTFVPIDDALIYVTDHGAPGSRQAIWSYFLNAIPRYLYPDKPSAFWGNIYAHQIGLLADDDDSTAVAFTPYADAYHSVRWIGVTVISCAMFLLLFFVCDSVAGTVADGPWALLYISWFAHAAVEGGLGVVVYGATTFTFVVIAAQIVTTYIAPVVGAFAIAPRRAALEAPAPIPSTST